MKTSLYRDKLWVFKSGICTAFRHQQIALEKAGVTVDTHLSDDCEIVHFNWYSPLSKWMMKKVRKTGKKIVVFAHTANDLRQSFKYSWFVEPILRRYLADFYSQADLLITPSEYCKSLIQGEGYHVKNDIHVISNGVDTDKFVHSEEKADQFRELYGLNGPIVMCVGQFIPRKGVVDFIETARKMPNYNFVWCGPITNKWFSYDREMHKALKNRPDNVLIAGFVPDIVGALSAADVFFFPSYEENQGIALLEAAHMGLPIVLRPLPVYEGWLEYGKNCLPGETVDRFVEQITKAYEDIETGERIAAAAKMMAEDHNLAMIGQRLLKAYETELGIKMQADDEQPAAVPVG